MNVIIVPVSELRLPERNVRIHTEKQLKEFERSIRMFGQIRPLIIDETNTILAGCGCYETLLRMGCTEVSVYRMENLTENQKKKLMIADNKIFNLGIDNLETFNAFLEELSSDLDIPGFDESILQTMVADASDVSDKIIEYGTIDDSEINSIKAAAERKEQLINRAMQSGVPPVTNNAEQERPQNAFAPATEDEEESSEPVEVRKYVICPHCGGKVWL